MVQSDLQGNIKLNPLFKNTEVYSFTPMYRFITSRMAGNSTSTLQAYILPTCLIANFPSYLISKVMSSLFQTQPPKPQIIHKKTYCTETSITQSTLKSYLIFSSTNHSTKILLQTHYQVPIFGETQTSQMLKRSSKCPHAEIQRGPALH